MDNLIHILFHQANLKFFIEIMSFDASKYFFNATLTVSILSSGKLLRQKYSATSHRPQGWSGYVRPLHLAICTPSCRSVFHAKPGWST